jgi:hypothetical protein
MVVRMRDGARLVADHEHRLQLRVEPLVALDRREHELVDRADLADCGGDRRRSREVERAARDATLDSGSDRRRMLKIASGDHDVAAAGRVRLGEPQADARGATDDDHGSVSHAFTVRAGCSARQPFRDDPAGAEGLEPPTPGFGDRCSTS